MATYGEVSKGHREQHIAVLTFAHGLQCKQADVLLQNYAWVS